MILPSILAAQAVGCCSHLSQINCPLRTYATRQRVSNGVQNYSSSYPLAHQREEEQQLSLDERARPGCALAPTVCLPFARSRPENNAVAGGSTELRDAEKVLSNIAH